ncbi:MAG: GNAT family N-acetyltransferase, partial [Alphaproteobacteria bacterium]
DLRGLFAAMPPTDSFYLHAIWVDAMARGRGVGALLLDSVIAFGKDEGYSRTSLHVWADNHAALALYRSRGFVVLEELPVPRRPLMQHDGGKYLMATPA